VRKRSGRWFAALRGYTKPTNPRDSAMQTLTLDEKPPVRVRPRRADAVRRAPETGEHERWFRAQVAQGLAEADDPAAAWVTHEEAQASWSRKRAELAKRVEGAV